MTGWLPGRIFVAAAAIAAMAGMTGTAAAQTPVKPKQHFVGLVNGELGKAVVYTVCPGPVTRHRRGPVKQGQTLAVAEDASGHGYTGPFGQIYSWFQPVRHGTRPVELHFAAYGKPRRIPAAVRVPCDGKGEAVFSSCPYLAPCAFGWVPDVVEVTFENIAVSSPARHPGP